MKNIKKIAVGLIINIIILSVCFGVRAENSDDVNIENQQIIESTIQTYSEGGLTKNNILMLIDQYKELSQKYSNEEIAEMIETSKEKLESENISTKDIDSIIKVLRNFDEEQLDLILDKLNIDETISELESGATILDLVEKTTSNMTTADKADLLFSLMWSANILRKIVIAFIILQIYKLLIRCVIYKKAKKKAWAVIVPIYRHITMLKICGMSPWWLLLLFIPIIGWTILWLVFVASRFMLAEAFDKGEGFGLGLWLLGPIFETIIAFSRKTKYVGIGSYNSQFK